jgi:hypothetical protein
MKIQVLALSLLITSGAFAQQLPTREVNAISAEMKRINAQTSKARRSTADVMGESSEGGQVTLFRQGKSLLKMNSKIFGEMGHATYEVWFQNGQPLFSLERDVHYDKPLSGRVVKTAERRFYFSKNRLAAFKLGAKWQKLTPQQRTKHEKEIRERIARYSKLAK